MTSDFMRKKLTDVGRGASVLEVAVTLRTDMTGDTDGSTAVGDTRGEGANVAGLVAAGETHVVVLTVNGDVLKMALPKLLNCSLDGIKTTVCLTHRGRRVVGVASSTIPVSWKRLRVERDLNTPLLGDTDEEETSHPEMVAHLDPLAGPDLELPLRRHDLGVDATDVHAGIEACTVVGLDEVTGEDLASACAYMKHRSGLVR